MRTRTRARARARARDRDSLLINKRRLPWQKFRDGPRCLKILRHLSNWAKVKRRFRAGAAGSSQPGIGIGAGAGAGVGAAAEVRSTHFAYVRVCDSRIITLQLSPSDSLTRFSFVAWPGLAKVRCTASRCISIRSDVNFDKRTHIIIVIISHLYVPAPSYNNQQPAGPGPSRRGAEESGGERSGSQRSGAEIPWSIFSGSDGYLAAIDICQRKMKFLGAHTHSLAGKNKIRIMLKLCKAQQFTKWSTPNPQSLARSLHGEWQAPGLHSLVSLAVWEFRRQGRVPPQHVHMI